jgi:uncharacterized protein
MVRFVFVFGGFLLIVPLAARADPRDDLGFLQERLETTPPAAVRETDIAADSEFSLARSLLFSFYQRFLSSQDGDVCGFTPSCSRYAVLVIERFGAARGLLMALDRLQRCHGMGRDYYPLDPRTGRLSDPPEDR